MFNFHHDSIQGINSSKYGVQFRNIVGFESIVVCIVTIVCVSVTGASKVGPVLPREYLAFFLSPSVQHPLFYNYFVCNEYRAVCHA